MSSELKNLSVDDLGEISGSDKIDVGIVVSEWNDKITDSLAKACKAKLLEHGLEEENIFELKVPGAFELPLGAQWIYEAEKPDAIICLGCLIQGETPHFEYIASAVANGLMKLNERYQTPFIFGVLTTNTLEQAQDRSGGAHGNKGDEAAITALKMIELGKKVFKPF